MVPFKNMVYVEDKAQYFPEDEVEKGVRTLDISGTELRRRLQEGADIPEWFSFPSVVAELRRTHPPRHKQGFTVFFTGLSGSGKSTVANALMVKLMEMGGRPVTLLDGDLVRKHLCERARVLEGASRPEHSANRLCRERDHEERRYRDLCADRAVLGHSEAGAGDGRAARRVHRDSCGHADRESARRAIAKVSTRRRVRASSRASRASTIRTKSREPRDAPRHDGVQPRHVGAPHHRQARVPRLHKIDRKTATARPPGGRWRARYRPKGRLVAPGIGSHRPCTPPEFYAGRACR